MLNSSYCGRLAQNKKTGYSQMFDPNNKALIHQFYMRGEKPSKFAFITNQSQQIVHIGFLKIAQNIDNSSIGLD